MVYFEQFAILQARIRGCNGRPRKSRQASDLWYTCCGANIRNGLRKEKIDPQFCGRVCRIQLCGRILGFLPWRGDNRRAAKRTQIGSGRKAVRGWRAALGTKPSQRYFLDRARSPSPSDILHSSLSQVLFS